jgi:uncharacterized membrane protein required for colicin V production
MNSWNGLDFFIFLILIMNTVLGMVRGGTKEIISIMCLSAALIFTIKFTVPLADFLNSSPLIHGFVTNQFVENFLIYGLHTGPINDTLVKQFMYSISLLICFVGIFSICEAGLSMTGFTEVFSFTFGAFNRQIGGALGFTRGYIINLILVAILTQHLYQNNVIVPYFVSGSFFVKLFQSQAIALDDLIRAQQPENYQRLYQNQPYNVKDLYQELGKPNEPFAPQQQAPTQSPQPQQP